MGRSFDHATLTKTDAKFGDYALVYDYESDFYYFPFFKDSTMFVTEFRLEDGDTIHQRTEKISYIIGSGQHTKFNFGFRVFPNLSPIPVSSLGWGISQLIVLRNAPVGLTFQRGRYECSRAQSSATTLVLTLLFPTLAKRTRRSFSAGVRSAR